MPITAVIPTYNNAGTVTEAVESVLAQTHQVHEIIVVDDGSADDTRERLAVFGPKVRYLHKENGGVSSARNLGVQEAHGDWIAFLDADDVWHPRKLEFQFTALARRPEIALLGNRLYDWPSQHPIVDDASSRDILEIQADNLIVRNCLVTSTIVAKTEILKSVGLFDPALQGPEDHDLWIRVSMRAKVANLRAALTGYRSGMPGSLSKDAVRMETGMRIILEKLEHEGVFRRRPVLRRKAWGYFRYSCGFMRFRCGEKWAALNRLALSLMAYPWPYNRADVRTPFGRLRLLAASALGTMRGT
jgi:glycosyltransferase involved in cell wall biosynthesis